MNDIATNFIILLWLVGIIYGVIWAIGSLMLLLHLSRLAHAAALWFERDSPRPAAPGMDGGGYRDLPHPLPTEPASPVRSPLSPIPK